MTDVAVSVPPKAKKAYHGPRLNKYLPHFFVAIAGLEVIAFFIGVK